MAFSPTKSWIVKVAFMFVGVVCNAGLQAQQREDQSSSQGMSSTPNFGRMDVDQSRLREFRSYPSVRSAPFSGPISWKDLLGAAVGSSHLFPVGIVNHFSAPYIAVTYAAGVSLALGVTYGTLYLYNHSRLLRDTAHEMQMDKDGGYSRPSRVGAVAGVTGVVAFCAAVFIRAGGSAPFIY